MVALLKISNFIPHFILDVIIYPCWDLSYTMSVKGAPDDDLSWGIRKKGTKIIIWEYSGLSTYGDKSLVNL